MILNEKIIDIKDLRYEYTGENDKKSIAGFIEKNKDNMRMQTIFSLESFSARI